MHSLFLIAILIGQPPTPIFPPEPSPPVPAILRAANETPGVRIQEATRDSYLREMAQDYAEQMAAINSQSKLVWRNGRRIKEGHFGVERRYADIRSTLGMKGDEVTAESWPRQRNASKVELWQEMFKSWKGSSGHWAVVSARHDRFGDGLAMSKQGIWYACVLVADADTKLMAFTAEWCGPCRTMHPVIEQLKADGVQVEWVDIDRQPALARQYRVSSIPAVVIVRRGREIARHVGVTTAQRLREMMR